MKKISNGYFVFVVFLLILQFVMGCYICPPEVYDDTKSNYLPFRFGTTSSVVQGYNGSISHQGQYAVDFEMNIGTPVTAVRSGIVDRIRDNCPFTCPITRYCCSNHIVITHEDGSTASYLHLKMGGVCVEPGDQIERGDIIGLSGNTGISVRPHLHLQFHLPENDPSAKLDVTFADVDGDGIPLFGWIYTSQNEVGFNFCE